jgi:hypothetical protein
VGLQRLRIIVYGQHDVEARLTKTEAEPTGATEKVGRERTRRGAGQSEELLLGVAGLVMPR